MKSLLQQKNGCSVKYHFSVAYTKQYIAIIIMMHQIRDNITMCVHTVSLQLKYKAVNKSV